MFKIDLHVHTALGGDSIIKPEELIPGCRQVGLDAVCVTEHHSFFLSSPLKKLGVKTGFPVLQGLEYRAMEGHLLIYGLKVGEADLIKGMPMQWVVDWAHKRGGVAVPAHPYQKHNFNGYLGEKVLAIQNLTALETLNASLLAVENQQAREAALRLGIKAIGGSDAHGPTVLGRAYTLFFEPIRTEAELVQALRSGNYQPSWNNEFYPDERLRHWPEPGNPA
ncbi:MAG TPA: PHP domain-containing protein [Thermodesulfobacteriota bacterium]|nr:PHP domain-containing protein [Thermodesulfobacteriota bacterium]